MLKKNYFPPFKLLCALFCFVAAHKIVNAESIVTDIAPIQIANKVTLKSAALGRNVEINLYLPKTFHEASTDHTYPTLFVLGQHGEQFFHATTGVVKHLTEVERMPETIVVSINDDGASPDVYHNSMWGEQSSPIFEAWGDADNYLKFIESELMGLLASQYRANGFSSVISVSGSSFVAFYSILNKPDLFDSYVFLAAPDILGMGLKQNQSYIDAIEQKLKIKAIFPRQILFALADSDVEKDQRYMDNLNRITKAFAYSKTKDSSRRVKVFEDEGHYDVYIKTLLAHIEMLYPQADWSARYRDIVAQSGNALENLDKYYQEKSKRYGYTILPRATRWNSVNRLGFISRHLIQLERTQEAIEVSQRLVEYRPNSIESFISLSKAYKANGDLDSAKESLTLALEKANTNDEKKQLATLLAELND